MKKEFVFQKILLVELEPVHTLSQSQITDNWQGGSEDQPSGYRNANDSMYFDDDGNTYYWFEDGPNGPGWYTRVNGVWTLA